VIGERLERRPPVQAAGMNYVCQATYYEHVRTARLQRTASAGCRWMLRAAHDAAAGYGHVV